MNLIDLTQVLRTAAHDPRIESILLKIEDGSVGGMSTMMEVSLPLSLSLLLSLFLSLALRTSAGVFFFRFLRVVRKEKNKEKKEKKKDKKDEKWKNNKQNIRKKSKIHRN